MEASKIEDIAELSPDFTVEALAHAREHMGAIKRKFELADGNKFPLVIPEGGGYAFFALLMYLLADDQWCLENLAVISFDYEGDRLIAVVAKKHLDVWTGPEGMAHLKSSDIGVYELREYSARVMYNYLSEQEEMH